MRTSRDYLKKIRKEKKLSRRRTAELIGISHSYYTKLETGERGRMMSIELVAKISSVFGVEPEKVLSEEFNSRRTLAYNNV